MKIFKGDDTGGRLGRALTITVHTQYDLTDCLVFFNYQGITRKWEGVKDGDTLDLFFSHNETARMSVGTFKGVMFAVDPAGKYCTIDNAIPITVTTNLRDCYGDDHFEVVVGGAVSWDNIVHKPFEGQEVDLSTDDKMLAALGTIIEKLGGTVKASIALLALCAATAFGYTPESHTNSYERDGVTYAQRGGMGAATYVVTNIADRAGEARVLPKYLHFIQTDDTYPADAKWYYAQPRDYGHCSSVKDGDFLYRNFDMFLDDRAEFVVSVSGNGERFASVGVANCGTNLTERFVSTHQPSRYYKALAGSVVDGINENGVAISINLVDGVPQWRNPNGDIHPLEAVRWSLDHGTNALEVAIALATRIKFPVGWTQNFHWMVCDADHCYIVENGEAHGLSGRTVMTNFRLYPQVRGTGWERYQLLTSGENITNVWYTKAYSRNTDWPSEFKDAQEMEAAKQAWETHTKEQLRGHGLWQSVHTSCYDLRRKTLRIAVQEKDDWYVFAVPTGGRVKSVNGKDGEVVLDYADVGALPDDEELLKVDSDFRRAVEAVSPPFPEKIALASVTNRTGGAVQAADVNALPANDDYYQIYADDDFFAFDAWNAEGSGIGMYVDNDYASVLATGSEGEGAEYASDGIYYNYSTNSAQLAFPQDNGGTIATREWTQGRIPSLPAKWALANVTNATGGAVSAADVGALSKSGGTAENDAKYTLFGRMKLEGQRDKTEIEGGRIYLDVAPHMLSPTPRPSAEITGEGLAFTQCPTRSVTNVTEYGISQIRRTVDGEDVTVDFPQSGGTLALTSDIERMPTTGLVWNATSGAVKTANGAKTIGAADVGAYAKKNSFQINDGTGISVGSNLTDEHSQRAEIEGGSLTFFDGYGGSTRFDPYGYIYSTSGGMWQFPIGISGTVMVESWQSLSRALTDATTNSTADCECISTNICKLIEPHVEPVKVLMNMYDAQLEANWAFSISGGDMKLACTTNVDITVFQKANPVLTDKQTADDYRVIVTGGEMKFFTDNKPKGAK